MSIGIDTEKLNAQIDKLEKTKANLSTIFQNVKTDTTKLKDYEKKENELIDNNIATN